MSYPHAVIWLDHNNAQVIRFDAEHTELQKLQAHHHATRQHGSEVRTGHEFFGEVCDALEATTWVLVTGSHMVQADFRHYVDKHRPATAGRICGWETVDHPSQAQLVALARHRRDQEARGLAAPAS